MTLSNLTQKKRNFTNVAASAATNAANFSLRKLPANLAFFAMTGLVSVSAFVVTSALVPTSVFAQEPTLNEANLTFVGADIESVIKAIGHYTGTTFIIDPRVKGTINLVTERPVTKAQAFSLLTSTLRLQGYAVVTANGFTKVVPESDGKLQAGPTQVAGVKGDQIATQVYRLNYENAANLVTVLRPLISPNNTISANQGTNSVIVTDYADNLKRMGKIIATLDVPASSGYQVIPLKYAIASDIAPLLVKMTEQASSGPGLDSGKTTIIAESRTNAILLYAPSNARVNLVKGLIAKLDQPTVMPGNIHVVYLRNAEALTLAQTLRAIYIPESSTGAASSSGGGSNSQSQPPNRPNSPGPSGFGGGSSGGPGGSSGSGFGSGGGAALPASNTGLTTLSTGGATGFIQADAATNTLIITASETVYRNLRPIIDQLDARRAQVYIEAMILDLTNTDMNQFGVQWAGITGNANTKVRVGGVDSFSTLTTASGAPANIFSLAAAGKQAVPTPGFNLGILSSSLGLGAIASALQTTGIVNILSAPTLTTLDNEEASVLVGQNIPLVSGQYITPSSGGSTPGGGAAQNPFQTVERKDIGVILKVRPQISEGGAVKLTLYQETSSVASAANPAGLILASRKLNTTVIVDDGQILVLGGLMSDNVNTEDDRVPFLGDIPYLGNFFKSKIKTRTKSNLLVFLRPTVLRNLDQANAISIDRYDYMKAIVHVGNPKFKINDEPTVPKLSPEYNSMLLPQTILDRESTSARLDTQAGSKTETAPVAAPEAATTTREIPVAHPAPAQMLAPTTP